MAAPISVRNVRAGGDENFHAHRAKLRSRALGPADGGVDSPAFYPLDPRESGYAARASAVLPDLRRRPTTGQCRVLTILVDFPDLPGRTAPSHYDELLFTGARSMSGYFSENSYGMFAVTGEVHGWVRLPHPYSYYVNGECGDIEASYPNNSQKMVEDAVQALKSSRCAVNFANFDKDEDKFVDGLIVIHAGGGAETVDSRKESPFNHMWSHKGNLRGALTVDGVKVWTFAIGPEDGRLGLFCHEFGHILGLPDLYDRTSNTVRFGSWCLMSRGSWAGATPGDHPTHVCAWGKKELGWVEPINVPQNSRLELMPVHVSGGVVYRVWRKGRVESEYFLLENRQFAAYDSALPGPGLLIWHVHEGRTHNDHPRFAKVCIESARNHDWRDVNDMGSDADPFPGSWRRRRFDSNTEPNSRAQNLAYTGVSITDIRAHASGLVTCKVRIA